MHRGPTHFDCPTREDVSKALGAADGEGKEGHPTVRYIRSILEILVVWPRNQSSLTWRWVDHDSCWMLGCPYGSDVRWQIVDFCMVFQSSFRIWLIDIWEFVWSFFKNSILRVGKYINRLTFLILDSNQRCGVDRFYITCNRLCDHIINLIL